MEVNPKELERLIEQAVEAKADAIREEVVAKFEEEQYHERAKMLDAAANVRERVVIDPGTGYQYAVVELAKIQFNPVSNRTEDELQSDSEGMSELIEDIKTKGGLLRPLLVYRKDDGYMLVKGARRLVALRAMGEESVHAYILPMKPPFALEESWVNGY